ncbi:N-acetyltransferase [Gordonia sp. IITR100]|uniref:GNAT family N-acetyltransferase n=1 Tax=Gordonia sp. IITR100 TaxID=1314686 RepID=UPI0015962F44|nr:GNAT family N-acetyltransferase [Gordonia sp. IITR100]
MSITQTDHDQPAELGVVTVRAASVADLTATSTLHVAHLRLGLFPRLGRRFVQRWHTTFLTAPGGVGIVATTRDTEGREVLLGFLLGTTDRDASRSDLISFRSWPIVLHAAVALALRPVTLVQFLRTRLVRYARRFALAAHTRRKTVSASTRCSTQVAELDVLAVSPAARRLGLGAHLVELFVHACETGGAVRIELVAPATTEAVSFYRRTGWEQTSTTVTSDGAPVALFARPCALTKV